MKTILNTFMALVAVAALSSCMDNANEWDVENAPNGNRTWAPTGISVTKGAKVLKLSGINATNATGYVAQASPVNFDVATAADIIEAVHEGQLSSKDTLTITGLKPTTQYYLRVKATSKGKEDSQWVQYCSSSGDHLIKTTAVSADTIMFNTAIDAGACPEKFTVPLNSEGKNSMELILKGTTSRFRVTESTSSKKFNDGDETFNGGLFRLQSQRASEGSDANWLVVKPAYSGKLTIYAVASASNVSRVTSLIVKQNGVELASVADLPHSGNGEAVVVDVVAGADVVITYPSLGTDSDGNSYYGAINFYGAKFEYDPQDQ